MIDRRWRRCLRWGAAVGFVAALLAPVAAQSVRLLGDFRQWSAYATSGTSDRLCFVLTKPTAITPALEQSEQSYFYITHRLASGVRYELSLVAGFEFAPDTLAIATISGRTFSMFTQADAAWLEDLALTTEMTNAMRAGATMEIESTTIRGIKVRQAFSLSGVTAALRAMDADCL
jgi:invasion associated locus B (IalB) protein